MVAGAQLQNRRVVRALDSLTRSALPAPKRGRSPACHMPRHMKSGLKEEAPLLSRLQNLQTCHRWDGLPGPFSGSRASPRVPPCATLYLLILFFSHLAWLWQRLEDPKLSIKNQCLHSRKEIAGNCAKGVGASVLGSGSSYNVLWEPP